MDPTNTSSFRQEQRLYPSVKNVHLTSLNNSSSQCSSYPNPHNATFHTFTPQASLPPEKIQEMRSSIETELKGIHDQVEAEDGQKYYRRVVLLVVLAVLSMLALVGSAITFVIFGANGYFDDHPIALVFSLLGTAGLGLTYFGLCRYIGKTYKQMIWQGNDKKERRESINKAFEAQMHALLQQRGPHQLS